MEGLLSTGPTPSSLNTLSKTASVDFSESNCSTRWSQEAVRWFQEAVKWPQECVKSSLEGVI